MAKIPRILKPYFPFLFMLRSALYKGKGAIIAENCYLVDGRIRKTKSAEDWLLLPSLLGLLRGHSYKKDDGTHQKFVTYARNDYFVVRAINSDKTVVSPTLAEANEVAFTGVVTFTNGSPNVSAVGGAFTTELSVGDIIYADAEFATPAEVLSITDNNNLVLKANYGGAGVSNVGMRISPHYSSGLFSFRQIGKYFFIGNDETTLPLSRWDGTALAKSANAPTNIKFLVRDKNKLAAGQARQTVFSEEDFATSNDWTAGAGVKVNGTYKTEIIAPKAAIEAGSGIIIAGEIGSDAQKVIPNNSSDQISADTSIDGFSSPERGVDGPDQMCAAGGFVFKINPEGIHRMNSFTGESENVTKEGEIGRKWKNYNTDNAVIVYDIENKWVVACVQLGARNDTLIVIDVSKPELPIFTVPDAFYSSLFVSGNELFGGSSSSGLISKVFQAQRTRLRYSQEWDEFESSFTEKKLKKISVFANASPISSFDVNLYADGSDTLFWTGTFQASSSSVDMADGAYGDYVFEAGAVNLFTENADRLVTDFARTKFTTLRWEIINDDQYDFEILDFQIVYKTKSDLVSAKSMNRLK